MLKIKSRRAPTTRHGDHGGGGFTPPLSSWVHALVSLDFIHQSARRYAIKRDYGLFPRAVQTGEWAITTQPAEEGVEFLRVSGTINKPKRSSK